MTNSELTEKTLSLFNQANWDEWRKYVANDATMEDMAAGIKAVGVDEVLGYVQGWKTGFPDMEGTCVNRIDAGDTLVEECTWTGTNTGNIMTPDGGTIPPTGKSVNLKNVLIYEFEGERIKSMKNYLDMMTMMSQLGLAG